jgi:hypothetical protein
MRTAEEKHRYEERVHAMARAIAHFKPPWASAEFIADRAMDLVNKVEAKLVRTDPDMERHPAQEVEPCD